MEQSEKIIVELIYIEPNNQTFLKVELTKGCNIKQAIHCSGILECFPEIDLQINKVGIFSNIQKLDTVLKSGDRIEIYRSLLADPKEARRQRAKKI